VADELIMIREQHNPGCAHLIWPHFGR
jgi:hypothetical protein